MAVEDKACDRGESMGFGEGAQRRIRTPGPAAARMDFINGLLYSTWIFRIGEARAHRGRGRKRLPYPDSCHIPVNPGNWPQIPERDL